MKKSQKNIFTESQRLGKVVKKSSVDPTVWGHYKTYSMSC